MSLGPAQCGPQFGSRRRPVREAIFGQPAVVGDRAERLGDQCEFKHASYPKNKTHCAPQHLERSGMP